MKVEELKKEYEKLSKKYELPDFKELNETFFIEIEKIKEGLILFQIRRIMLDRINNWVIWLERFLNPVNLPRMYWAYVKSIDEIEKKEIERCYSVLCEIIKDCLSLEIQYNEKGEAEQIKRILNEWNSLKEPLRKMIKKIKNPPGELKKEKNYFG